MTGYMGKECVSVSLTPTLQALKQQVNDRTTQYISECVGLRGHRGKIKGREAFSITKVNKRL